MIEHPEFKNPTTKNLEGLNEEVHKDEATTKVDSDNTEPPIESKDHVSKKIDNKLIERLKNNIQHKHF